MRTDRKVSRAFGPVVFRRAALRWEEALPVGNGEVGGMLFGNRAQETLLLNHIALRLPTQEAGRALAGLSHVLPEVRRLMAAGRPEEAERRWHREAKAGGYKYVHSDPCHPAGQLDFTPAPGGEFAGYRRELDLERGLARVTWREEGVGYERLALASRGANVVMLRLTAERRGGISGRVSLGPVPHAQASVWLATTYPTLDAEGWAGTTVPVRELVTFTSGVEGATLTLEGRYRQGGGYAVAARVCAEGGTAAPAGDELGGIVIQGADRVVVWCAVEPGATAEQAAAKVRDLPTDAEAIVTEHAALHGELMRRCVLELTDAEADERSAEELVLACDGEAAPAALTQRMWGLGRYLLVSSARAEGMWPPHLQGLWTGTWRPAWFGNYTWDENVQMCHWQAEGGGLGELTGPLHRLVARSLDGWRANAKGLFGCEGVLAPLMQGDGVGRADCAEWHFWLSGAGWTAQHAWDRWLFGRDRRFLEEQALPLLREIARFYEGYLTPGPDGRLSFTPSVSVENKPEGWPSRLAVDATMDVAVAREVLTNLCEALRETGGDAAEAARWREMLQRLPAYRINEEGALAEWIDPRLGDHYEHRHLSHLYPLFPGMEVDAWVDAGMAGACAEALRRRRTIGMHSQTGWSWTHLAHVYARLGDGEEAGRCLERLMRSCVTDNLLTTHNDWRAMGLTMGGREERGTFQIDANLGFSSAAQEMLCQSTARTVTLLPALPTWWRRGSLGPMRTRTGHAVTVRWDQERGEASAEILGEGAGTADVRWGRGMAVATRQGEGDAVKLTARIHR